MISFGIAIASEATYRAQALPGIRRIAEPGSLILAQRGDSLQSAYNRILDEAGRHGELEALVLLHQDVEIVDRQFMFKLRRRIADANVAVVGVVGARGVRSLAWWEGDCFGGVAAPALLGTGRIVFPGGTPQDVDVVDGLLMALSPWAVRQLRFDEAFAQDFHGYDVDLCFQARALGRRVVVDDLAVVHHAAWAPRYGEQWIRSAVALKRKWGASWAPGRGCWR
ncbi:MAG: glycosyltransferase family protein [Actinomycetota bacterium]|nr:glycosyltransferase family protein [Actinomycetota bacterium]